MISLTHDLIEQVIHVAKAAGRVILQHYHTEAEIFYKSDNSPVLQADLEAHRIIEAKSRELTPDILLISEEGQTTLTQSSDTLEQFWLVDPLDGTKEFIQKNGEFTVNIALIERGRPILGVVYAPALDSLYVGSSLGAFKRVGTQDIPLAAVPVPATGAHALRSRSHADQAMLTDFLAEKKSHSGLRLALRLSFVG